MIKILIPLLKDSFNEFLQELLEVELDASMGYDKNNKGEVETVNKRNGYSPKTAKSEFPDLQLETPRDHKVSFNQKSYQILQGYLSNRRKSYISVRLWNDNYRYWC